MYSLIFWNLRNNLYISLKSKLRLVSTFGSWNLILPVDLCEYKTRPTITTRNINGSNRIEYSSRFSNMTSYTRWKWFVASKTRSVHTFHQWMTANGAYGLQLFVVVVVILHKLSVDLNLAHFPIGFTASYGFTIIISNVLKMQQMLMPVHFFLFFHSPVLVDSFA